MTWWPWWMSGLFLAAVTLGFWRVTGRLLSGSGMLTPLVELRRVRAVAREEAAAMEDPTAFLAALQSATAEQFATPAAAPGPEGSAPPEAVVTRDALVTRRLPWTAHLTFLAALVVGGVLSRAAGGNWDLQLTLGPVFERLWGTGLVALGPLLAGGVLVGFGTRMAGGCTVGHGLSGCSRLQPGSLVGTAAFMGSAVAISFLLAGVLG